MNNRHIRLLAHNVRSLWNVGAFFRTCDALKIERLYLTGYTGVPPRREISKVAIGAEKTVPFEAALDPFDFIKTLRSEGWQIVALELTKDAIPLTEFKASDKVCLVVGHEIEGVSPEMLSSSDATVMIPMLGSKESLNVAVATGIALHHLRFS